MTKIQVFTLKGTKKTIDMPRLMEVKPNIKLLAQANYIYEDRMHKGTSKVKTRSLISASGAKIYKQKGTGRARHGDVKAPIFVGGGIAHGPHGIKRLVSLPKKLKDNALKTALNLKAKDGLVVLVEKLSSITKTGEAKKLLDSINKELGFKSFPHTLVALLPGKEAGRGFRNIKGVEIRLWQDLNSFTVFTHRLLVADKEAFTPKEEKTVKSKDSKTVNLNAASVKPLKPSVSEAKPVKKAKKVNAKTKTAKPKKTTVTKKKSKK